MLSRSFIRFLGAFTLTLAAVPLFAAAPLPGAIFTTDGGCHGTDLNIYGSSRTARSSGIRR